MFAVRRERHVEAHAGLAGVAIRILVHPDRQRQGLEALAGVLAGRQVLKVCVQDAGSGATDNRALAIRGTSRCQLPSDVGVVSRSHIDGGVGAVDAGCVNSRDDRREDAHVGFAADVGRHGLNNSELLEATERCVLTVIPSVDAFNREDLTLVDRAAVAEAVNRQKLRHEATVDSVALADISIVNASGGRVNFCGCLCAGASGDDRGVLGEQNVHTGKATEAIVEGRNDRFLTLRGCGDILKQVLGQLGNVGEGQDGEHFVAGDAFLAGAGHTLVKGFDGVNRLGRVANPVVALLDNKLHQLGVNLFGHIAGRGGDNLTAKRLVFVADTGEVGITVGLVNAGIEREHFGTNHAILHTRSEVGNRVGPLVRDELGRGALDNAHPVGRRGAERACGSITEQLGCRQRVFHGRSKGFGDKLELGLGVGHLIKNLYGGPPAYVRSGRRPQT